MILTSPFIGGITKVVVANISSPSGSKSFVNTFPIVEVFSKVMLISLLAIGALLVGNISINTVAVSHKKGATASHKLYLNESNPFSNNTGR